MLRALALLAMTLATPLSAQVAAPATAEEIELAIDSGRLDQARLMIATRMAGGLSERDSNALLAHLAFASGRNDEALTRYQAYLKLEPADPVACERAGIAALRLERQADAKPFLTCATAHPSASWRAWNGRAVLADLEQDWEVSAQSYATALKLGGENAMLLNNIGYSHLMQGHWQDAIGYFERAHARDPSIKRIANNLELARAAVDVELPARRPNESASDWAARLNDAGVAAEMLGDRRRAIANFTRALEASGRWYARAANNLAAVEAE